MRIYDPKSKRVLDEVTLFLTPDEARQLALDARDLSAHPNKHHHHLNDETYKREITIAVHTAENFKFFDAESRKVIESP